MIKTKAIMKNKHKAASAVLAVVLLTCSFTACNQKREFGEGVYHMESDPNVTITITDVVDTPGNEDHEKICKVQFSENFDFSEFEENVINYEIFSGTYFNERDDMYKPPETEEEIKKRLAECEKIVREKINCKKQFIDNPCTFYMMHNEGESFSSLFADVDGTDYFGEEFKLHFEIVVDEYGRLIVDGDTEKAFV